MFLDFFMKKRYKYKDISYNQEFTNSFSILNGESLSSL